MIVTDVTEILDEPVIAARHRAYDRVSYEFGIPILYTIAQL